MKNLSLIVIEKYSTMWTPILYSSIYVSLCGILAFLKNEHRIL